MHSTPHATPPSRRQPASPAFRPPPPTKTSLLKTSPRRGEYPSRCSTRAIAHDMAPIGGRNHVLADGGGSCVRLERLVTQFREQPNTSKADTGARPGANARPVLDCINPRGRAAQRGHAPRLDDWHARGGLRAGAQDEPAQRGAAGAEGPVLLDQAPRRLWPAAVRTSSFHPSVTRLADVRAPARYPIAGRHQTPSPWLVPRTAEGPSAGRCSTRCAQTRTGSTRRRTTRSTAPSACSRSSEAPCP